MQLPNPEWSDALLKLKEAMKKRDQEAAELRAAVSRLEKVYKQS